MTAWEVSRLRPSDLEEVLTIERQAFDPPWGRIAFEGELEAAAAESFVIREPEAGSIAAYIFFRWVADEVHVFRIAVAPAWRRRGMGRELVDHCLKTAVKRGAQAVLLEVRPSNSGALQLYRQFGFRVLATRPAYYADSREAALILHRDLKEEEL